MSDMEIGTVEVDKYPSQPRRLTLREKLTEKRDRITRELQDTDRAIAALDANPGFEEAFDALRRVV